MTKRSTRLRCRWCGRELPQQEGPGRRRIYCRQGCRQQAHISRKLAATHGLGPDQVVISRQNLEELLGALYGLQAALEDVDADLREAAETGGSDDGPDYRAAYEWLYKSAQPLRSLWIEPHAI